MFILKHLKYLLCVLVDSRDVQKKTMLEIEQIKSFSQLI